MVDEWGEIRIRVASGSLGTWFSMDWKNQSAVLAGRFVGSGEIGICRLNLNEKRVMWRYLRGSGRGFYSIAICPERNSVFCGEGIAEGDIFELDYESGELRNRLVGHSAWVARLEVINEGRTLVSCSADQTVRIWDLTSSLPRTLRVLRGHEWEVRDFAIHPNGRDLITASKDGTVRSWSMDKAAQSFGRIDVEFGRGEWVFGPDNSIYAIRSRDRAQDKLWRISGKRFTEWDELDLSGADLGQSRLLRDSNRALLAEGADNGRIRIWDLSISAKLNEFTLGNEPVRIGKSRGLANLLLHSPGRKEGQVWDLSGAIPIDRDVRLRGDGYGGEAYVPLPGGQNGWSLSFEGPRMGSARGVFHVFPGGELSDIEVNMEPGRIMGSGFTRDGRHCFVAHEPGIIAQYTYDPEARQVALTRRYAGAPLGYRAPGFTLDGRRLVAPSAGAQIISLWDIENGAPLITLPGLGVGVGLRGDRPKFSADESLIGVTTRAGVIHVWRAPTFEEIEAYESVPDSRDIPLMRRLSE